MRAPAYVGALAAAAACVFATVSAASVRPGAVLDGLGAVGESGRRWSATARLERLGASRIGRGLGSARLTALLSAADATTTVDEVVGIKLLGTAVALVAAILLHAPLVAPPLALLAWRGPEISLARRARRRIEDASSEVPLFLDLLAVSSSAGTAPQLAMRHAAEPLQGPLAAELGGAIRRTELGRRWRDEIGAVGRRLDLPDLRRATTILGRSEALGSAFADEVARLASDVREERRSRAAERARTAPVRMLFPLVFLILPAFLLLTVVPVLLSTVRSIT